MQLYEGEIIMSIILKHIVKNIWENKIRSFVIILSLIITSIVTLLCLSVSEEIDSILLQTLRSKFGNMDFQVTSALDNNTINIDEINIPEYANKLYDANGIVAIKNHNDYRYVFINGFDIKKALEYKVLKDNRITNLSDNEVIITENAARELNITVNDEITVFNDVGNEYIFKVKYIVKREGYFSKETSNIMLISNLETAQGILNYDKNQVSEIYLSGKDLGESEVLKKDIANNNENLKVADIDDMESLKGQISSMKALFILIFVSVFLMVFFVVNALSKLIINERITVIGTFRSIGATKSKMNFILLLENVLYGLVGGVIGALIGSLIKDNLFIKFVKNGTIDVIENSSLNLKNIVLTIIITIILQLFMSIFSIIKNSKRPIKELIFNTQSSKYNLSKFKVLIGFILLVLTIVLYYLNSRFNMVMSFIELISLVVGITFITPFILTITSKIFRYVGEKLNMPVFSFASNNIKNSKIIVNNCELIIVSIALMLSVYIAASSIKQYFVELTNVFSTDILISKASKDIKEYNFDDFDNVDNIYPLYFRNGNTKINDMDAERLYFLPNNNSDMIFDFFRGIKIDENKFANLKDDEIIIDSDVLKRYGLKIGDTIKITFNVDDEKKMIIKEFKIIDVCDSHLLNSERQTAMINFNVFLDVYDEIPFMICVNVKDKSKVQDTINEFKNKIKDFGLEFYTQDEYINLQKNYNKTILGVVGILIGMGIALSFIGITNNQIIGFMQRKREYAVLYSTSMSKGQIKKLIILETLISFGVMGICAISLSYLFKIILEQLVNSMYTNVPVILDIKSTILLVFGIYIVMIFTTIIPKRKINKMNVISEIKYE